MSAFSLLILFIIIGLVLFSSAMFYAENGTFNEQTREYERADGSWSPFQSIPETMWWGIVTMTTVGYGTPYVPITFIGKIIACVSMVMGVLIIAMPVAIVYSKFLEVY